jgi:large subunit ribosomal protein L1
MTDKIIAKIKELRESSKKRNFPQSFDLVLTLKEFDTKKAENKFSDDFFLPNGRGKDAQVVVFSEGPKDLDCKVVTSKDVTEMVNDKREVKKLATKTDFFLAEAKMMPVIGKAFGQSLAPRGKMPKILGGNEKEMVSNYKKAVRIRVKDSPVIQFTVGKDSMTDEQISANIESVVKYLETKLTRGNIGRVLLKTTMGKPVKLEVF